MLIGLHGKARAGKDTAFGYIDEYFEQTATAVYHKSFALPLKVSALAALGIDTADPLGVCDKLKEEGHIRWSYGPPSEHGDITGREYLQKYGTEAHRDVFGQDFWVKACLPDGFLHMGTVVVVTDVRFPNEAERIHELGGSVWQIIRGKQDDSDAHASEQPLDEKLIDAVVHNDSNLVAFKESITSQVTETVNRLIGGKT
jgi:hypothetical protein